MRRRTFHVILITILCLSCSVRNVQSTVMMKQSLGDLARRARMILQGNVVGVTQEWNEDKTMIFSVVRIAAERVIKGEAGTREVVIRQPGGMIGGTGVRVEGYPQFSPGEETVVFLEPFEASGPHSGARRVVGMAQGMFRVETDPGSGKKVVLPSGEMPTLLDAQGREVSPEKGPIALDEFIASIQREISKK